MTFHPLTSILAMFVSMGVTIVRVRLGTEVHEIRYGTSSEDSVVQRPILPFLEKLAELKKSLVNH
ncbi:hypothetical protein [uncultured Sunxiuqinia sp.]|uniref:hypothetical protein n=1 Tax=uncultured Sunxiuqinia sp. TaxID=1573825 RepID=UPI002AA95CC7|nr:hypothetical protein [uncultured Sunxiuqinia sp.]